MNVQAGYPDTFSYNGVFLLRVFTHVAVGISVVSILVILTTHLLFPRLRRMTSELVVMLLLSNLLCNIGYEMHADDNTSSAWCTTSLFFLKFAAAASYMWNFCIALTIHKILVRTDWSINTSNEFMKRYRCWAHLICWSAALVIGFPINYIGYLIKSPSLEYWVSIGLWATLHFALLFYLMFVYYHTWNLLRMLKFAKGTSFVTEDTRSDFYCRSNYITKARLKLYPAIYLVQVAALLADKACATFNQRGSFTLFAINITMKNLQGFVNSMIFGCTDIVLYEWTRFFRRKRSSSAMEPIGFEYTAVGNKYKVGEFSAIKDDIYSSPAN